MERFSRTARPSRLLGITAYARVRYLPGIMPDKSGGGTPKRLYRRLPVGRHPRWMKPSVPFYVYELGKSRRVRLPDWWAEAQQVMASGKPYFLRDGQDPNGIALRGRPGLGALAILAGELTEVQREFLTARGYRLVKKGFGRTLKEAEERGYAWLRARQFEAGGKARQRARRAKPPSTPPAPRSSPSPNPPPPRLDTIGALDTPSRDVRCRDCRVCR